jgi:hypothetical protein
VLEVTAEAYLVLPHGLARPFFYYVLNEMPRGRRNQAMTVCERAMRRRLIAFFKEKLEEGIIGGNPDG